MMFSVIADVTSILYNLTGHLEVFRAAILTNDLKNNFPLNYSSV